MKKEMLILSLGQAGGNIAEELFKKDFNVFCVNSSTDDLDALDIPDTFKFHIANASGTAKNRDLSKQLAAGIAEELAQILKERFKNFKYIHLVSSAGGGTGGGSIAAIAQYLSLVLEDRFISMSVILPSTFENIRLKNNAIATFSEISRVQDKVGPIFLLSNQKVEKFRVNQMHAEVLEDIVNLRSVSKSGSLDKRELEEFMQQRGVAIPYTIITSQKGSMPQKIDCYADLEGAATYSILSLSKSYNQQELHRFETLRGITISNQASRADNKNYVFYAGIKLNTTAITELQAKVMEEVEEMQQAKQIENEEIKVFDLNAAFSSTAIETTKVKAFKEQKEEVEKTDLFEVDTQKEEKKKIDIKSIFSF